MHTGQRLAAALKSYFSLPQGNGKPHGTALSLGIIFRFSPHTFSDYICVLKEVSLFFANLFRSSRRLLMLPLETTEGLFMWGQVFAPFFQNPIEKNFDLMRT